MKSFFSAVFCCIIALLIPSCNLISGFQDVIKKSDAASTAIYQELDSRPEIFLKITNGVSTEVNVQFDELVNKDITVAELEEMVKNSVEESMDGLPKTLLVTIKVDD
jgi:hypothetical protein